MQTCSQKTGPSTWLKCQTFLSKEAKEIIQSNTRILREEWDDGKSYQLSITIPGSIDNTAQLQVMQQ